MAMPKIPEKFETQQFQTEKKEVLIGILSDTHIPTRVKELPRKVKEILQNKDLILHSGDIVNLDTLKELEKIAPTFAVEGNMDFQKVREKLPEGLVLQIYKFKIGILHSPLPSWTFSHLNWFQERVVTKLIKEQKLDILIFGHTHRPLLKELNLDEKKVLLINPGSPTVPFLSPPSIATLKITKNSFLGEIIYFEK
jgi:hypothetical protein